MGLRYILVVLASVAVIGCTYHETQRAQKTPPAGGELEPRFAPPDTATVRAMRAHLKAVPVADRSKWRAGNWENPVVVVTKSGVVVQYDEHTSTVGDGRPITLRQLPEALAAVPPGAWPYGRWVLIAEPSLGAGDDDPSPGDVDATRRLLMDLGVEAQAMAT
jgi:hypothetical protein